MTTRKDSFFCIIPSNLFSSVPKSKGKKTKDVKKSVKVPAEPQTVVGQSLHSPLCSKLCFCLKDVSVYQISFSRVN